MQNEGLYFSFLLAALQGRGIGIGIGVGVQVGI